MRPLLAALVVSAVLAMGFGSSFRGDFRVPVADSIGYFSDEPRATADEIVTILRDNPGVYYSFYGWKDHNIGSPIALAEGAVMADVRAKMRSPRICTQFRPDLMRKYDDTMDHTVLVGTTEQRYCANTAVNSCTTWEGYMTHCQGGSNPGVRCVVGDSTCTGGGTCGAADEVFDTDWVLRVPRGTHDALVAARWGGSDPFDDPVPAIHNWSTLLDLPAIRALENASGVPALYADFNTTVANETFIGSVVMDLRIPMYRTWAVKHLITELTEDYGISGDDDHCLLWGYKPGWYGYEDRSYLVANYKTCRANTNNSYGGNLWNADKPVGCPDYAGWGGPFHDTQYGPGEYEAATNALAVELLAALDTAGLTGVKIMTQRAPQAYSTTIDDEVHDLYHSRRYIGEIQVVEVATPIADPACSDGLDNDSDAVTDYPSDPGCASAIDTSEFGAQECDDGEDNDDDGDADLADSGCASLSDTLEANCGDGAIVPTEDCDDGNTVGGDSCSPTCTDPVQCDDGVDNDSDGDTDHPADGGCASEADDLEANCGDSVVSSGEQCDDGNTTPDDGCSATCQNEVAGGYPDAADPLGHEHPECLALYGKTPAQIEATSCVGQAGLSGENVSAGATISACTHNGVFDWQGDNITIDCVNWDTGSAGFGTRCETAGNCANITIRRTTAKGNNGAGSSQNFIKFSSYTGNVESALLEKSDISESDVLVFVGSGINSDTLTYPGESYAVVIRDNRFHHITQVSGAHTDGIYLSEGAKGVLIERNLIDATGSVVNWGSMIQDQPTQAGAGNHVFRNNHIITDGTGAALNFDPNPVCAAPVIWDDNRVDLNSPTLFSYTKSGVGSCSSIGDRGGISSCAGNVFEDGSPQTCSSNGL